MTLDIIILKDRHYLIDSNFKYREAWTLANGTVSWRCCSKGCSCSLKTNGEKTKIVERRGTHTHRAPCLNSPSNPLSSTMQDGTPGTYNTSINLLSPINSDKASSPATSLCLDERVVSPEIVAPDISGSTPDVVAENAALKMELAEVRAQRQAILDHSIESDLRLLQFTDEVFSMPTRPTAQKAFHSQRQESSSDKYSNVKEPKHPSLCERCKIMSEEVKNMIGSIRILEEENRVLKEQVETLSAASIRPSTEPPAHNVYETVSRSEDEDATFTTVVYKKPRVKNKPQNQQKPINSCNIKTTNKKDSKKISPKLKNESSPKQTKIKLPFKNVTVLGDSHARYLASLMLKKVHGNTNISGVCKPGAGLLDVAPSSAAHPSDHCYVLLAGTNDVDAGRQHIIYSQLENVMQRCCKTSSLLVLPLPPRYDLPASNPVHRTTIFTNSYVSELCGRYDGVEMLDICGIRRHHFTSHGLHLRTKGKKLLADLILRNLAAMAPHPHRCTVGVSSPVASPTTSASSPRILPHETFADAVRCPTTRSGRSLDLREHDNGGTEYSPAVSARVATSPETRIYGEVSVSCTDKHSKNVHFVFNQEPE